MATPSQQTWKTIFLRSLGFGAGFALMLSVIVGLWAWQSIRPKPERPWNTQAIKARFIKSDYWPKMTADKSKFDGEHAVLGYTLVKDKNQKSYYLKGEGLSPQEISTRIAKIVSAQLPWEYYASYRVPTVEPSDPEICFSYSLENTTSSDYTLELPQSSPLVPMRKLKQDGSLISGTGLTWSLAQPIYGASAEEEKKIILIPADQTVRVDFSVHFDVFDMAAVEMETKKKIDWSDAQSGAEFASQMLKDVDSFVLLDKVNRYRIDLPLQAAVK